MGHFISGIIALSAMVEGFSERHDLHLPFALTDEYSFLPLSAEHLDVLYPDSRPHTAELTYLPEALHTELVATSKAGPIVYFETSYCGGDGTQGAMLFQNGEVVYGPVSADMGPISEALRLMGVKCDSGRNDEFAALGLDRFRTNADWIRAANPQLRDIDLRGNVSCRT